MKKKITLLLSLLVVAMGINAQTEVLLNGTFEAWDDVNNPTSWTKKENIDQESTIKRNGLYSAKHTGGTKDLAQTITGITPGTQYTISIWYKIDATGNGARIWSYWKDSSNGSISDSNTDADLRPSSYFTKNDANWNEYNVTVTAPEGAVALYFELRTYSSSIAYWDDISITKAATSSVVAPTFSPAGGTYYETQNVTISSTTADATIFYTLDGSDPKLNVNRLTYSSPIPVAVSTTIKAYASNGVLDDSNVETAVYTITEAPVVADLVINEIMQNPSAVSDANGEWFEIYNNGVSTIDINGYQLKDNGSNSHTINNGGPLNIAAGGYLVLGNNADMLTNGGVNVDYAYTSYTLGNSSDAIILYLPDGSTEVDRVEWDDGATFPDPNGFSMTLHPSKLSDNNNGDNWYQVSATYGDGDHGTPGAVNGEDYVTRVETVSSSTKVYGISKAIVIESETAPVFVYSLDGKLVYQGTTNASVTEIPVQSNGVYFVRVAGETTKVLVK